MSSNNEEPAVEPEVPKTAGSPSKKVSVKKETFQWSTPADEFAEDVRSDSDDDDEEDMSYMDEVTDKSLFLKGQQCVLS